MGGWGERGIKSEQKGQMERMQAVDLYELIVVAKILQYFCQKGVDVLPDMDRLISLSRDRQTR